jgi:AraC-like DNA-binding protein
VDVLDGLLAAERVGGASGRLTARAPWGLEFDGAGAASFHIVVRGECWLRPAADAEPILLRAGDVTLLPGSGPFFAADHPDTPTVPFTAVLAKQPAVGTVAVGGTGPETTIICGYDLGAYLRRPVLSALPSLVHVPAGQASRIDAVTRLIAAELERADPGALGVTARLVEVLLVYILRAWQDQPGGQTVGWFGARHDPAVGRALELMHQAPGRRWTGVQLAAAAGLSRSAFARRFTAHAGEPPQAYLTRQRMVMAAALLREGTEPLSVIADRVGYESEFAFARTFRRAYGLSPGRYRRQSQPVGRTPVR